MRPGRLLLFWDYDTQWGSDTDRRRGLPTSRHGGAQEFDCTEELLALHGQYGIPACFAVVAAAALPGARPYHDPDQVRRIHAAGHEIASHGLHHEWIPALGRTALRSMLRRSREVLEQCIAAPVTTFVPPYNQPFDCPRRLSFSRSERRAVPIERTDLAELCRALGDSGFSFCRVAYRSMARRAADRALGRLVDGPVEVERLAGVHCARLNTPGGFGPESRRRLEQAAASGGLVVAYGHPHSLHSGGPQDLAHLAPFLERAAVLRLTGHLEILCPVDLIREQVTA